MSQINSSATNAVGGTPEKVPLESPSPSEVFRLMGTYYLYQDQIGWNRTQTLVVIEAGVLAGAFSRQGWLGPALLVVGSLVVYWIYQLILRDWQIRDHLGQTIQPIVDQFGLDLLPPPSKNLPRGRAVVKRIVFGLIATNMLLVAIKCLVIVSPCLQLKSVLETLTK